MRYIAGVDIGNSSTEAAIIARNEQHDWEFVGSGLFRTTGLKGTKENVPGVLSALDSALEDAHVDVEDLEMVLLNEAAPVIGDVAMETITETVITESTMIGHDPSTPGGTGLGTGTIVDVTDDVDDVDAGERVIVLVDETVDFADAAERIDAWSDAGVDVQGAIVQKDDAVLINNRIRDEIPIVDEVSQISDVPMGQPAAVEVADPASGKSIEQLSNPYGIATVFDLSPEETQKIIPVARALVGNKSAVVIKTPQGEVKERTIPAGSLHLVDQNGNTRTVEVDEGADTIMDSIQAQWPLADVHGESGSNIGGMLNRARAQMADITGQAVDDIRIRDVMAVDTLIPQRVEGSVAGEFSMENAVGLAAMVKTSQLPMRQIADRVEAELDLEVTIQGIEAHMAVLGALTTPGTDLPLAILDMGGGSTDAAFMNEDKEITSIHLAGAGDMVTMLIDSELGLDDRRQAEAIKKHPVAKVETLFSIRHENGTVTFLDEHVEPEVFGRVVLLKGDGEMEPVTVDASVEKIRRTRRDAKEKVFVANAKRALRRVTPVGDIRHLPFVVMIGRSALDFEIPEMISDALAEYGIVCGRGNIRGKMGPRNGVATGLCLSYIGGGSYLDFDLPSGLVSSLGKTVDSSDADAPGADTGTSNRGDGA